MLRAKIATVSMLAILFVAPTARGEPCTCCSCQALDLRPPDPATSNDPVRSEYQALLASGATLAIAAYFSAFAVERAAPQSATATDLIPIAGAIASAMRGPNHSEAPLLSFLGSAQAMGLLMVVTAVTENAERRRWLVGVGAGPNGCSANLTMRIP